MNPFKRAASALNDVQRTVERKGAFLADQLAERSAVKRLRACRKIARLFSASGMSAPFLSSAGSFPGPALETLAHQMEASTTAAGFQPELVAVILSPDAYQPADHGLNADQRG